MFASIIIISFSFLLFLYWFRYTCLLILSAKTTRDYAGQVAAANQMEFPTIQASLRVETTGESLDALSRSLERDYVLVTSLLRHASQFQVGALTVEQRMLMIDYQVMKMWFSLSCRFPKLGNAKNALEEMSGIVAHFANEMGERAAAASRA